MRQVDRAFDSSSFGTYPGATFNVVWAGFKDVTHEGTDTLVKYGKYNYYGITVSQVSGKQKR